MFQLVTGGARVCLISIHEEDVHERSCFAPEDDHRKRLRGGILRQSAGNLNTQGEYQTASRNSLAEQPAQTNEETYATMYPKFGVENAGVLAAAAEAAIAASRDALASGGTPRRY